MGLKTNYRLIKKIVRFIDYEHSLLLQPYSVPYCTTVENTFFQCELVQEYLFTAGFNLSYNAAPTECAICKRWSDHEKDI